MVLRKRTEGTVPPPPPPPPSSTYLTSSIGHSSVVPPPPPPQRDASFFPRTPLKTELAMAKATTKVPPAAPSCPPGLAEHVDRLEAELDSVISDPASSTHRSCGSHALQKKEGLRRRTVAAEVPPPPPPPASSNHGGRSHRYITERAVYDSDDHRREYDGSSLSSDGDDSVDHHISSSDDYSSKDSSHSDDDDSYRKSRRSRRDGRGSRSRSSRTSYSSHSSDRSTIRTRDSESYSRSRRSRGEYGKSRRSSCSRRSRRSSSSKCSKKASQQPQQIQHMGIPPAFVIVASVLAALFGSLGGVIISQNRQSDAVFSTFAAMQRMHKREDLDATAERLSKERWPADVKEAQRKRREREEENRRLMKEYIGRNDHLEALKRFGEGPHRVMVSLEIPALYDDELSRDNGRRRFFIETPHLKSMPHSTLAFLDMVQKGMFNNVKFNSPLDKNDGGESAIKGFAAMFDGETGEKGTLQDADVVERLTEAGRYPAALSHAESVDRHYLTAEWNDSPPVVGFVNGVGPGLFVSTKPKRGDANMSFGRVESSSMSTIRELEELMSREEGAPEIILRFARILK